MLIKTLSTVDLDSILNVPSGADAPSPTSTLEIEVGDKWIPAEAPLWRAWTGRRTVWGMEYHGPVYTLEDKDGAPWDGPRVCGCHKCQAHVRAEHRPN